MANASGSKETLPGPSSAPLGRMRQKQRSGDLQSTLVPTRKRQRVKSKTSDTIAISSSSSGLDEDRNAFEAEVASSGKKLEGASNGTFEPVSTKNAGQAVRNPPTAVRGRKKCSVKPSSPDKIPELTRQLLGAAHTGTVEEVISLAQKRSVNVQNELGNTPLHVATQYYRPYIVRALLDLGGDPDIKNFLGKGPLHIAATSGFVKIVEMLVAGGADINARDFLGMTPLHWSVEKGYGEVVKALLENGANVELRSKFHQTPMDIVTHGMSPNSSSGLISDTKPVTQPDVPSGSFAVGQVLPRPRSLEIGEYLVASPECMLKPIHSLPQLTRLDTKGEIKPHEVEGSPVHSQLEGAPCAEAEGFDILKAHGIDFVSEGISCDPNFMSVALEQGHTISLTDVGREILKHADDDDHFEFRVWESDADPAGVSVMAKPSQSNEPDLLSLALQNGRSVSLTEVGKQILRDVRSVGEGYSLVDPHVSLEDAQVSATVSVEVPLPDLTHEEVSETLNHSVINFSPFVENVDSGGNSPTEDEASSFTPEIIPAKKVKIIRYSDGAEVQVENKIIKLPPTVKSSNLHVVRVPRDVFGNEELFRKCKEQLMRQTARLPPLAKEA